MREITLKELLEAGCHFGHQSRRWNPAMKDYIYAKRDGVHIFDLAKTKEGLDKAREYVRDLTQAGGKILFVGTKRQATDVVREQAEIAGMPYVSLRWLGGTLTNFAQIQKSVREMISLKERRAKGELKRYTKYEQLQFDRRIAKLERFLGGIAQLNKLPEALFVVDTHREAVAVAEANRMNIPVVGMADTNSDPRGVDYVIPINDDAAKSIELVVKAITEAVSVAKEGAPEVKSEEVKPVEKKKRVKKVKTAEEPAVKEAKTSVS